ncbi:MAG: hypothetical protein WAM85_20470 [Terracidiphilus sp.]
MRRLVLLLLLTGIAFPAFAAKRVTVAQLQQTLGQAHGASDAEVAKRLAKLELTERLGSAKLAAWEEGLPGVQSRATLVALADSSAFLDPPPDEIPATPAPNLEIQREMMQAAVEYAEKTLSKLPNFFATRDMTQFEDEPSTPERRALFSGQPLQPMARSSATVLYRDSKEVVDWTATKHRDSAAPQTGLIISGEFGPILNTVLEDVAKGRLAWSHWEQGAAEPEAVFHYAVPKENSHYEVQFCCLQKIKRNVFRQFSGYHGEIAVNPSTGTILRLTMQADLKPAYPMARADLMVEYGPVEIGGKTYICPVRSVALALAEEQSPPQSTEPLNFSDLQSHGPDLSSQEFLQTLLNDVAFGNYHLFRSESRILPANGPSPEQK